MAHPSLIAEVLTAAALENVLAHLSAPDSELSRWLDEVSQPPPDVSVRASRKYTGVLFLIRNRVKRALVFEHRESLFREEEEPPRPPGGGGFFYEDDEFPSFG